MKPSARPILTALGRSYAAQAATQASRAQESSLQVTKLANGATVATVEDLSPLSRVAFFYNGGSRSENQDNEGLTHALRRAVSLGTKKATGFGITKNIQQLGGSLNCTTTREHLVYSMECLRNNVDQGLQFLGHAATAPAFKPWEVSDNLPNIQLDLAVLSQQPHVQVMEAVHRAAYRDGLGYSLYMPSRRVGTHSPTTLSAYVSAYMNPSNMAIVATGVEHDSFLFHLQQTMGYGRHDTPAPIPAKVNPTIYHGGELRIDTSSDYVHAVVVTEGVGLGTKDMLASAVLQKLVGTGPTIKYSTSSHSKLTQAVAQVTGSPFAASALNINYTDSGLFGFYVACQASEAGKVLKSIVGSISNLTKGSITEQEVTKAKMQLKSSLLMDLEGGENTVTDIGTQLLLSGDVQDADSVAQAIDRITTADVNAIAKKVINGKPSMAAVGDLSYTPYLDQLI